MKFSRIQQPARHIKNPRQFGAGARQASRFRANNATMALATSFVFHLCWPSPDE
jgi:hypothetical protein